MHNTSQDILRRMEDIANQWPYVLRQLENEMEALSGESDITPGESLEQLDIIMRRAEYEEEKNIHYPIEELLNDIEGDEENVLRERLDKLRENCSTYFEKFEKKGIETRQKLLARLAAAPQKTVTTAQHNDLAKEAVTHQPLLQPIHGISLQDYATAAYYQAAGIAHEHILAVLGITPTIWNEVNALWTKRMEEDAGLTAVAFFSRYYNEAEQNKRFHIINSPNV